MEPLHTMVELAQKNACSFLDLLDDSLSRQ